MNNQYKAWKQEPFTNRLSPEAVISKINEVIKGVNQFYGLVGMNQEEAESIYTYVLTYLNKFPLFKLIDMDRAFELCRRQPELNKLTPAYFESVFNQYRRSPERAEIMKLHNEETENRVAEKSESTTKEQRFNDCFAHWKLTGEIRLNSGAVYVENFKSIKEQFGMEELTMIAEEAKAKFIQQLETIRATIMKMADHHELQARIDSAMKGGPEIKNVIRKAHLKAYFEVLEKSYAG